MKNTLASLLLAGLLLPSVSYADWIIDIFNQMVKLNGINLEMKDINSTQLARLSDIKNLNQSQLEQVMKLTAGLTGTRQMGGQYHDANRFNWGVESNDWQAILALVNQGGGPAGLGAMIKLLSMQFPMKDALGSSNTLENDYYRMQAQTTIATRAGAELSFKQINQEAEILQRLHQLIDTTTDQKSSVDLNNRLVAENAMINIQQAKLLVMLLQQTAMDSQEKANRAKESAEFFDIK